ncbi:MAG: hypothetical protein RQ801_02620 [Spirochaetaceae bacterium]|nr:hypothetical protein [Spirochaetaceae bacterium]MDT8297170.1 hypothetical protein [Spirochaetaceae bacterium]
MLLRKGRIRTDFAGIFGRFVVAKPGLPVLILLAAGVALGSQAPQVMEGFESDDSEGTGPGERYRVPDDRRRPLGSIRLHRPHPQDEFFGQKELRRRERFLL